jgi:DNA-directed RNA polymerase specialized sigma24 family protein
MILPMLNINTEIVALIPAIKATVAGVLRRSRYFTDDHVEQCAADIMVEILDYGVRTFDAGKGSARSHFTCFAKRRALNWLSMAHRRFEVAPAPVEVDGEPVDPLDSVPSDTFLDPLRALESKRIRMALESMKPRHRALLEAYVRHQCWSRAAAEIGVSPATASRMKDQIAAKLR